MVVAVKMIKGVQIRRVMAVSMILVKGIFKVGGGLISTLSKLSPVAIALNCQNQSTVIGQSENWLSSQDKSSLNGETQSIP